MHFTLPARLLILASSVLGSVAQGPNTISSVYPNDQTASMNLTAWLVPVTKTEASKLAGGRTLLRPSGLPSGYSLGEDQHPVLFLTGLYTDISTYNFTAIKQLTELHLYVPWVQGVASSQKPFSYHYRSFSNSFFASLLGNLFQNANVRTASFDPPHAAYKAVGSSNFSLSADVGLFKSTPLFISTFQRASSPVMTVDFVSSILQQPVIRSGSKDSCHKVSYQFNETFANPFAVHGNLQTGSDYTIEPMKFDNAQGLTATAQWRLSPSAFPCASLI
ncbi:unnamed protein product [Tilletia controversa]|uniref:Uncharacterized protein n=1 Tax=Tilletia controversa TaxID=13291 RepID=A0A8X7MQ69_9BASI|nr:hypothetical protein A4X06_0g5691 [Tilletia controversa]CAD6924314.1 unnamed protein product [Tilletia controversa]CAD6979612.1 unnamed protein product [Tilletia controversa]